MGTLSIIRSTLPGVGATHTIVEYKHLFPITTTLVHGPEYHSIEGT